MNKDLITKHQKLICHKCRDFPDLAEETNNERDSEMFSDILFAKILGEHHMSDQYKTDMDSSIAFFETLLVPEDKKVRLSNAAGCLMCHSQIIPEVVHYAMITGLCDVKTVQYDLFARGIFYKEWYIKDHLKHINIKKLETKEIKVVTDVEIIVEQILTIRIRINEIEALGTSGSGGELGHLRKQLKEYLEIKLKLGGEMTEDDTQHIKFKELFKHRLPKEEKKP